MSYAEPGHTSPARNHDTLCDLRCQFFAAGLRGASVEVGGDFVWVVAAAGADVAAVFPLPQGRGLQFEPEMPERGDCFGSGQPVHTSHDRRGAIFDE